MSKSTAAPKDTTPNKKHRRSGGRVLADEFHDLAEHGDGTANFFRRVGDSVYVHDTSRGTWSPDEKRAMLKTRLLEHRRSVSVTRDAEHIVLYEMDVHEHLPVHPNLVAYPGGYYNLKDGQRWAASRGKLFTRCLAVAPAATHEHSLLRKCLHKALPDDVRDHFECLIGYWISGHTNERVWTCMLGGTTTGKSTIAYAILQAMGEYGATLNESQLLAKSSQQHLTHWQRLEGVRFALVDDLTHKKLLNTSEIKQITSGTGYKMPVNRMRENPYMMDVLFKLVCTGNHEPRLGGCDSGLAERLCVIRFDRLMTKDASLRDKLIYDQDELARTVAYLLWCGHKYACLPNGLVAPGSVRSATQVMIAANNDSTNIEDFIDDRHLVKDKTQQNWTHCKTLFEDYREWARTEDKNCDFRSSQHFTQQLIDVLGLGPKAKKRVRGSDRKLTAVFAYYDLPARGR